MALIMEATTSLGFISDSRCSIDNVMGRRLFMGGNCISISKATRWNIKGIILKKEVTLETSRVTRDISLDGGSYNNKRSPR